VLFGSLLSVRQNVDNRKAHYETTAPEILAQLPNLDAFSCAVGTGGTLAGCAMYFREHRPDQVKIGHTDPQGARLHRFYLNGELAAEGSSITEGIGQGRVTANLEGKAGYSYSCLTRGVG
jgi:cysteine synthase